MTEEKCKYNVDEITLCKKLHTIIMNIGQVKEDERNMHQKFDYISHQKMTSVLKQMINAQNIFIKKTVLDLSETHWTNHKSVVAVRSTVKMRFEFIDLETGASITGIGFGAAQDTAGKSSGQAMTECEKRFMFKFFMVISDEEDPDGKQAVINMTKNKKEENLPTDIKLILKKIREKSLVVKEEDESFINQYIQENNWSALKKMNQLISLRHDAIPLLKKIKEHDPESWETYRQQVKNNMNDLEKLSDIIISINDYLNK